MKIFKLRVGQGEKYVYVKVDDTDAHLMRNYVWTLTKRPYGLRRRTNGSDLGFTRAMGVIQDGDVAEHRNGDPFDYRRANLRVLPRPDHMRRVRINPKRRPQPD